MNPHRKFAVDSDDPFIKFAAQTVSDSMRSILQLRDISSNQSDSSVRGQVAAYIKGTAGVILCGLSISLEALNAYENSGGR